MLELIIEALQSLKMSSQSQVMNSSTNVHSQAITSSTFAKWLRLAEKYLLNLLKSNQTRIVISLFRLIWHRMEFRLARNQLDNSKYNLISVNLKRVGKDFSYSMQKEICQMKIFQITCFAQKIKSF